jgi:hypothetical protein
LNKLSTFILSLQTVILKIQRNVVSIMLILICVHMILILAVSSSLPPSLQPPSDTPYPQQCILSLGDWLGKIGDEEPEELAKHNVDDKYQTLREEYMWWWRDWIFRQAPYMHMPNHRGPRAAKACPQSV